MSAVPVTRRDFDLTGGVLRLTSLYKNRLILAELADGSAGKDDILAAIGQGALDYYRQRLDSFNDPYILVFGTMDSGTQIEGPVDKLTLSKPFSKGRIGIDSLTGKLKLEPHER